MVDIATPLLLGEDDLIITGWEALRGVVDAPVVAGNPDDIGHTSRRVEDNEDVGFYDLANERGYLAIHCRYGKNTPKKEG